MHPGSTSKVGSSGIRVGKGVRRMLRLGLKYEVGWILRQARRWPYLNGQVLLLINQLEELVSRGNDKEALGVRGIEEDDPGDFRVLRMVNGMDAGVPEMAFERIELMLGMTLGRLA
ncbi:hypothetical protein V6N13_126853 [Hibiscus sabdariffa]|uniref:Uncharacterized protein n=1 Tax=Hibiscus sabdariffa TaxID=183260 RepID=A0ABR2RE73_9ROSI